MPWALPPCLLALLLLCAGVSVGGSLVGLGLGATNPPGSTASGIGTYQSAVLVKPVGWEGL